MITVASPSVWIRSAVLLRMTQKELDDLYLSSRQGPIPVGVTEGILLLLPGTGLSRIIQAIARALVWRGKKFDPTTRSLLNIVTPLRICAVMAEVYTSKSWLDGKPCTALDYSKSSIIAMLVRDEIREVAPGLYLGKAFWGKQRWLDFILTSAP